MAAAAAPIRAVVRIRGGSEGSDLFATGSKVALVMHRAGLAPETRSFEFDQVFPSDVPTAQVHTHAVAPLCAHVLAGRHALLLAVGEARSGKGMTLSGPGLPQGSTAELPPGVVQLALRQLCAGAGGDANAPLSAAGAGGADGGPEWRIAMQHTAMYHERPFDLLTGRVQPAPSSALEAPLPGALARGLSVVKAASLDELLSAYARSLVALQALAAEHGIDEGSITTVCTFTLRQPAPAPSSGPDATVGVGRPGGGAASVSTRPGQGGTSDVAGEDELWSRLTICRVGGWEALSEPLDELRLRQPPASFASVVALSRMLGAAAERLEGGVPIDGFSAALPRMLAGQLGGNAHVLILCCVRPGSTILSRSSLQLCARARAGRCYPVVNDAAVRALHRQLHAEASALRAELATIAATGAATAGGALASEEAARAAVRQSELEGQALRAEMRAAALTDERDRALADAAAKADTLATAEAERRETLTRLLASEEESVRRGQALLDLKVEREAEAADADERAAELGARLARAEATADAESARAAQLAELHDASAAALRAARADASELEEDVVAYRSTLLRRGEEMDAAQDRLAALQAELIASAQAADAAERARDEARHAAEALAAELRGADGELARASAQADELRDALEAQRWAAHSNAARASELVLGAAGADAHLALARTDAVRALSLIHI